MTEEKFYIIVGRHCPVCHTILPYLQSIVAKLNFELINNKRIDAESKEIIYKRIHILWDHQVPSWLAHLATYQNTNVIKTPTLVYIKDGMARVISIHIEPWLALAIIIQWLWEYVSDVIPYDKYYYICVESLRDLFYDKRYNIVFQVLQSLG